MQPGWTKAAPTPKELEAAATAQAAASIVYFNKTATFPGERKIPPGWQEISHAKDPLGALLKTADAAHLVAPNGVEVVAFRGSIGKLTGPDWTENFKQGLGMFNPDSTPKHFAAAEIGRQLKGANVVFAGHSLGGGLATLAAELASTPHADGTVPPPAQCITFNAAAVTKSTFRAAGCPSRGGVAQAQHLVNDRDAVNRFVPGGKTHAFTGNVQSSAEHAETNVYQVKGGGSLKGKGHGIAIFESAQADGSKKFSLPIHGSAGTLSHAEFDQKIAARVADASLGKRLEQARGPLTIGARGPSLGR